jgi:type IV pilus assembly protein PilN
MANINLLPWRERLREERKQQFLFYLGISALLALVVLVVLDRIINSNINTQNEVNAYLREQVTLLDGKLAEIREIREQKEALTARMTVIQELQGNRPVIVRLFDELVRTLPEGVYYNTITRTNDSIALQGVAESNNRISALMRSLDDSEWFADPSLRQINELQAGVVDADQANAKNSFELTVKITAPSKEVQP